MKVPRTPAHEAARLAALRSFEVLDTGPERIFDEITGLAAHILGTSIALVSLVDADRQWFKSRYGLDAPETPRDISFCGHVVGDEVPLVVSDATADPRFADNPLVTSGPTIRFYAGVPLRTHDGHILGTLCAIDPTVKHPTLAQLNALRVLAGQVVDHLEARRARLDAVRQRAVAETASRRFESILDAMSEGVIVQDTAGAVVACNDAALRLLGVAGDSLNERFDDRWSAIGEDGRTIAAVDRPSAIALRTGEPARAVLGIVVGHDTTWVVVNSLPQRDRSSVVIETITTLHDITRLKQTIDRATQQERLAMAGTLAAGIGHEINNPLTYVSGNVDYALDEVRALAGPSPSVRLNELIHVLGEAREGCERIRKIVRGLRTLAREDVALTGVELRVAVETALSMAAHEVRHRATVVVEIGEIPNVRADETRLTQVLLNLVVNAAQAFERHDPSTNRIVISAGCSDGQRVSITVADNGPGIPETLRRRIFDPFFTTKPIGAGTGLGLSVSRSLIEMLGGELTVASQLGHGATFSIVLPSAASPSEPVAATASNLARARVLIVDDDRAVLKSMTRLLQRDHDVVAHSDPREALALLRAGESFDLILCDMMMPFLAGNELFAAATHDRPELADRFVFITGGVSHPHVQAFLLAVPNERIEKPFSVQNLQGLARRFAASRR